MRRATLAAITCWAIAGAAMGATPPPPQKKAVTPVKKGPPVAASKTGTTSAATKTVRPATVPTPSKTAAKTPASVQAKTPPKPATATRRYYGRQPVRRNYSTRTPVQTAPTSERFREIQDALAAKGYLTTPPTGVWDKASMDAMQRFQQDQKLDPTGKLTARSIVALGLGPKTAASSGDVAAASGQASPLQ